MCYGISADDNIEIDNGYLIMHPEISTEEALDVSMTEDADVFVPTPEPIILSNEGTCSLFIIDVHIAVN